MVLGKAILHTNCGTMLKYISMQNFMKKIHVEQELWAFSLIVHEQTDSNSDYRAQRMIMQL